jgi:hypothetical protein
MDRFHKRSWFDGASPKRAIGLLVLLGFALFVSFRIFTAPTQVVQRITSPDGHREARLLHVYYYSDPGYKIATRTGWLWHTSLYLPEYKKAAPVEDARLRWSDDSKELFFEINGETIWRERF